MDDNNDIFAHLTKAPFPAYKGDEDYIFISYAHVDAKHVFPDLRNFKELGCNVWYDQGIEIGMNWIEEIEEALLNCKIFVVFLSNNSIESQYVRNEINLAVSKNKPLVIIYLEEAELKHGLYLSLGAIQGILKYALPEELYRVKYLNAFKNLGYTFKKPEIKNNFMYLKELLDKDTGTIKLDKDITIDESEVETFKEGLTITNNNLTIEGNNHIIDANSLARILKVAGKNISIKNVTFKNGYAFNTSESRHVTGGGAILIEENASLELIDCKFLDNYSESDGGAIFNKSNKLKIERNKFDNNESKKSGGAIANINNADILNTRFKNNKSNNGGSLYNYHNSTLTMRKCKLHENKAKLAAGGIYNYGTLKIDENSNFRKNSSNLGGAIVNYGISIINNASFKGNSAHYGGAIFNIHHAQLQQYATHSSNYKNEKGSSEFNDCTFAMNNADKVGGAIYNLSECKLTDCEIGNNTAREKGNIISNGSHGMNASAEAVIKNQHISVLDISSNNKIRLKKDLENDAIYNQEDCLLRISETTTFNNQTPVENNPIILNKGDLNFY